MGRIEEGRVGEKLFHEIKIVSGLTVAIVTLGVLASAQTPGGLPEEIVAYADTIFYNGQVLTADDQFTIAEALAVRDGKILAVGSSDRIQSMAGPRTMQVDLKGNSLIPGFYDTHLHIDGAYDGSYKGEGVRHLVWGRDSEGNINVTRDEYLKKLGEYVQSHKPGEWVLSNIPEEYVPITRKELDALAPDNPVELRSGSGPGEEPVFANTKALELAQIPPDTPGFHKDSDGQPSGILWGFAAGVMEYEAIPYIPVEARLRALKQVMKMANGMGLTMVATRSKPVPMSAIKTLWESGELTLRWRLSTEMIRMNPNAEMVLKRVGNLDGLGDDMFKLWGSQSGNPDGGNWKTTWTPTRARYDRLPEGEGEGKEAIGKWWNERGKDYWTDLQNSGYYLTVLANRYGWRTTMIHSGGDRANSLLLDAYEEAHRERPITGRRFSMDHAIMVTPEHIQKMKELDVIPSVYIALSIGRNPDELVRLFGADRVAGFTPLRSMIDAGLKPVAESDSGFQPGRRKYANPLWGIEKYITRKDEQERLWGPDERINRKEALNMYTNWAAYYTGDEKILGSLEPGKLADLVVLDGDYMQVPEEEISELRVLMTLVNGKIVFERETSDISIESVDFHR